MVVARKVGAEYKYVLNCDRGLSAEKQTVFHYRSLSLEEQYNSFGDEVEYEKIGDGELKAKIKLNKAGEIQTLVGCITKIENLKDETGKEVIWPAPQDEAGRKAVLAQLDGAWRAEITEAIRGGGTLSEPEVKN